MKINLKIVVLLVFSVVATAQKVTHQELEHLIKEGKIKELKEIVSSNEINVGTVGVEIGEVPLLFPACSGGDLEIIEYLLQQGANPNSVSRYGMPANWAAERGNLATINLLLDYGFDPKKETLAYWMKQFNEKDSLPPLMKKLTNYVAKNKLPITDLPYTAYTDPSDPLILTAAIFYDSIGDFTLAKRLITAGNNVNLSDKKGKTALHNAIESFNVDGVNFLIKNRANVNKPIKSEQMFELFHRKEYNDNITPLHYVLYLATHNSESYNTHKKQVYKIAKSLVKAGANPNAITISDSLSVLQKTDKLGDSTLIKIISRSK